MKFFKNIFSLSTPRKTRARIPNQLNLDRPLLYLSNKDPWSIRDAFEGTAIFGATGAGKTTASGQILAKAFLRAGFGGLVLTAKPDERRMWIRYCKETGRSRSLLMFGPEHPFRFNFLEYELRRPGRGGGMTENILQLLLRATEVSSAVRQNSSDPYWQRSAEQLIRNLVDLCSIAYRRLSLPMFHKVIASAPQTRDEATSASWQRQSHCFQTLNRARNNPKTAIQKNDYAITRHYWLREFPTLSERTRSIIVSMVTGTIDLLLRGPVRELICTKTNITPEASRKGAIILLDLPIKEYRDVGRMVQTLWKYSWQLTMESKALQSNPRPVFLWADEAQYFIGRDDALFQMTARSSRVATVFLSQNIPNYNASLGGGERARAETESLLGNLSTKIFHSNSDLTTNRWASELVARDRQLHMTYGRSQSGGEIGRAQTSLNTSGSDSYEFQIQPIEFTRLRKGGPPYGFHVDGIVTQSGRVWRASGTNFLRVTFNQRRA